VLAAPEVAEQNVRASRGAAGHGEVSDVGDGREYRRACERVIRDILGRESAGRYDATEAQTFHKVWPSASRPALVTATDGQKYVVKGSQNARTLFTEYVCGRLGQLIGAPTIALTFVDVAALKRLEPQMSHFGDGLALGGAYVQDASDRTDGIQHLDDTGNKERFAGLALLYAWARGNDCQFIYSSVEPRLVFSNDHGHFFPGQTGWTAATLAADDDVAPVPSFGPCGFVPADFATYRPRVTAVTGAEIRMLVGAPPINWNVSRPDRDAVAEFLIRRQARVAALYS
jgi:hypothetical protein